LWKKDGMTFSYEGFGSGHYDKWDPMQKKIFRSATLAVTDLPQGNKLSREILRVVYRQNNLPNHATQLYQGFSA
jgi:hypothetical protein